MNILNLCHKINLRQYDADNNFYTFFFIQKGDGFTVAEIFGDEWNLPNGYAGVFGRRFNKLISEKYSDRIRYTGYYTKNGNAIYEML